MSWLESDFKRELRTALRTAGCVCELIPDLARAVLKPYDMVAGIQGRYVAIETKLRKTGVAGAPAAWKDTRLVLTHADLRPNQLYSLSDAEARGCAALIIAGLYDRGDCRRAAWVLPYTVFCQREKWTIADLRGDVLARELPWARGQGWDVAGLVTMIGT